MQTETPRLRLRPFTLAGLDDLHQLFSDPEVMRHVGDGVFTRAQTEANLARMIGHWERLGFGMWALHDKQSGRFVGRCGIKPLGDTPEIELGYTLHREFWGRGLAAEAARASLRLGFEAAGLPRIVAIARPENLRSRRVMEKVGMRYERTGPDPYSPGREVVWYGLSLAEYHRLARAGRGPEAGGGAGAAGE
jgi:ribosomal-protein-alanine N-acetyltransferase